MTDKTKDIQDELKASANKIWLAGLGALSAAEEEGNKLFKSLVERGEQYESKGREAIDDVKGDVEDAVDKAKSQATGAWDKAEDRLDAVVSGALKRFGVPTRSEIATLTQRVEELTAVVEKLHTPAKKAPAKSTSAKAAK
ncbi:MAG: phasin family protein [Acidobacteriota bacterium]